MNRSFRLRVVLFGAVIALMQSQIAAALTPTQISEKAQQITVRIDGPDEPSSGSGVIIDRQGNTYYVFTNAHLMDKKGDYTISAPDGKRYPINRSQVKLYATADLDLAVLQFTSNQNYQVAEKDNYNQIKPGANVYVAGFPLPGPAIKERIYSFLPGSLIGLTKPISGYQLVYNIAALPGTSGGPILNEQGQLVGIHGLAERDARTGAAAVTLGIPINAKSTLALLSQGDLEMSAYLAKVAVNRKQALQEVFLVNDRLNLNLRAAITRMKTAAEIRR